MYLWEGEWGLGLGRLGSRTLWGGWEEDLPAAGLHLAWGVYVPLPVGNRY